MKKKLIVLSIWGIVVLLSLVAYAVFHRLNDNDSYKIAYTATTMPEIYYEIIDKLPPTLLYSRNDVTLPYFQKLWKQNPDNPYWKFKVAVEHIFYGTTEEGIKLLEELEKDQQFTTNPLYLQKPDGEQWSVVDSVRQFLALGYLRLAEQTNCILNHNDESCVYPISGGGVHINKDPAREAIRRYLQLIQLYPDDHLCVWLLNIALQAYGSVPSEVPAHLVIAPERFPNEYNIGRFDDIAVDLGIENTTDAGGLAVDDFDNDGYIDIINGSVRLKGQIRYFHNNGDGTFSDWTDRAGLQGAFEGLNLVQLDYNNDGWMDFIVPRGGWKAKAGFLPSSLYRNNGDGTFTDVTIEAGLLQFAPTQTAEAADIDLDGDLDLFFGNEYYTYSRMYLNNGDGTFTDVSKQVGIYFKGYVKGASFGDYNNDGYPDLYISDFGNENRLYRNNGPDGNGLVTFTDVAEEAGVTEPIKSFPCWFFDYNNDGFQDIYVSAYKPGLISAREFLGLPMDTTMFPCLYRNNGDGTFTNMTLQTNIAYESFTMGCNYGDLDNDGWLDFYQSIGAPDYRAIFPNRMYRNNQGKYFQDCTVSGGFGQLQKGHAVSFCDFDYDGDQDVYTDYGGFFYGDVFQNAFYLNPGHGNNWINIRFEGTENNRFGVGCRIKLTFTDNGQRRHTYFVIGKGASFGSNPIRLQAGLGKATVVEEIEVIWPKGQKKQVFRNVPVNRVYWCREDAAELRPVDMKPITFRIHPHGKQHHAHAGHKHSH
ncbi:MAG: CRTAC1 family protein [Chitinophagales bacterium]|nr:CRTAC1 family protein [Chitinophagales bacterium]MDW8428435.1 CRTAC1 family protein [Chitinophagales bacterium]